MTASDRSHVLTFLYKIIDDNQATIRFLDTKAAFGVAILGAVISKVLDKDQLAAFGSHGNLVLSISIVFGLFIVLSAILGYKTVFPTVNPAENISFPNNLVPKFFISEFKPRRFQRLFSSSKKFAMLETTHSDYCAALGSTTQEGLESITAAEVLKLSFIRQLKIDRLSAFAKSLIPTVILFMIVTVAAPKSASNIAASESAIQDPQGIYCLSASSKDGITSKEAVPLQRGTLHKGSQNFRANQK